MALLSPLPVSAQLPTTLDDFFVPGTQPDTSGGVTFSPIRPSSDCQVCHEAYDPYNEFEIPIGSRWRGSMMGNSARDPLLHAALAIANQDAEFGGDMCLRCHTPGGWLGGRSVPTDGSALLEHDFDGVNCNFCHRMVDPAYKPGISPPEDVSILDALKNAGVLPRQVGDGAYVVDPADTRRGPFDDVPANYHGVPIIYSPFHSTSEFCGTCHDVSNPAFMRQEDGSYLLGPVGEPHPTEDKYDMFPLERTYSEWLNSSYATMGVDAGGVFGGNHPTGIMRTCQDCHMPDTDMFGCAFTEDPFFRRPDVPAHDFNGGNAWVQDMIRNLYPTAVASQYLEDSKARARYMLGNAATLELDVEDCYLRVRIVNETGHKLPTGYPEGRRMWINVIFHDALLHVVAERGAYDPLSADLTTSDTRVYETKLGMDVDVAALTGKSPGPSFHFVLNNVVMKDNRIPPRGFTNAAFEAVQAAPVGAIYEDGQYWDDARFFVPPGAVSATVRVFYQTSSKEYITFLRDMNTTNEAGDILYEQWELTGKSPPVLMRQGVRSGLTAGQFADADCNGSVDLMDYQRLGECLSGADAPWELGCEVFDANGDGRVDLRDVAAFQTIFKSQ